MARFDSQYPVPSDNELILKIYLWLNKKITWSQLARIGNSGPAKITLLAPFVAPAVIYAEFFFQKYFGYSNVVLLYWSLMSIAFAQLLYVLFCPGKIKKYADDQEIFIHEEMNLTPICKMEEYFQDRHRSLYLQHSGKFTVRNWNANECKSMVCSLDPKYLDFIGRPQEEIIKTVLGYLKSIREPLAENQKEFDWRVLTIFNSFYPLALDDGTSDEPAHRVLHKIMSEKSQEDDWKINTMLWRYTNLNEDRRVLRIATFLFYFVGICYLLFSAIINMFYMLFLLN